MIGGRAWNWVVSLEGLLGKAFGLTPAGFGLLVGGGGSYPSQRWARHLAVLRCKIG
jgi:hypothetical protein